MRGVQDCYAVAVFWLIFSTASTWSEEDLVLTSNNSFSFSSNRTILFSGYQFEIGIFSYDLSSQDEDRNWYLGIWFKKIPIRKYVWVANRDKPLSGSKGTLRIRKGNLVLFDNSDTVVWSTNTTQESERSLYFAELLDDGNFVLRHSNRNNGDGYLWQSFDHPTDTLLKGMKLGWELRTGLNNSLTSWKDINDPSSGNFSYRMETVGQTEGFPRMFIWKRKSRWSRVTPWRGIHYIDVPQDQPLITLIFTSIVNKVEASFHFHTSGKDFNSILALTPHGLLVHLLWNETSKRWEDLWRSISDGYNVCGSYGYCNYTTNSRSCLRGSKLINQHKMCVRETKLNCIKDGFFIMTNITLPDTINAVVVWDKNFKECEGRCLRDCNCTAFAITPKLSRRQGCLMWTGEILDVRNYDAGGGQEIYLRYHDKRKPKTKLIIWICVGVISLILVVIAIVIYFFWRRKQTLARRTRAETARARVEARATTPIGNLPEEIMEDSLDIPLIDLDTLSIATDGFSESNKLGKGGFGVVYKGRLEDGVEIAVKRLSKVSGQGMEEFKTELKLITKVQHINLVRLVGYCIDGEDKLLVYEYLPNRSLDLHLFDKTESSNLKWHTRFEITKGIARGLSYLHEESAVMIIHRDLKPSNILLGKDMTPKISDFGMARIFDKSGNENNTTKIMGTHGYMAPEYSAEGNFSVKSDVFSFGVMVLEIICGKRNTGFSDMTLLSYVWKKWKEGDWENVIDPVLDSSSSSSEEIKRCIQIGLLCVQDRPEDRPIMSLVSLMLLSKTEPIPQPYPPGYHVDTNTFRNVASSSYEGSSTVNQGSFSIINPR